MPKNVPPTRRHGLLCAPCVCSLWLAVWAGPVRAQPGATAPSGPADRISAHLQLEAPARCATSASLMERVALRSRRIELGATPQGAAKVRISIAPAKQQVTAQLSLVWPDGTSARRTLSAARCDQVVDALALLLVLALDPSARSAEHARAASSAEHDADASTPPTLHEPSGDGAAAVAATSSLRPPPAQRPATSTDQRQPSQPSAGQTSALSTLRSRAEEPRASTQPTTKPRRASGGLRFERISLGALASLITGVVPGPLPGVGAALAVAWSSTTPWSPALSLGVIHAFRSGLHEAGGVAAFQLNEAVLEVCPLALHSSPFRARSCLTGALGSLSASGSHTYSPSSEKNLWASLGGSVLGAVDVSELFVFELRAGLGAPLSRPRFAFAPQVFYRVAAVTFEVQFAIAAHFW